MNKYPSISREEAINKILRVIKVPLATVCDNDRGEALYYAKKYNISGYELIGKSFEKLIKNDR